MREIELQREALVDVHSTANWLDLNAGIGRGDAFIGVINDTLAMIADAPLRWPPWKGHAEIRRHAMKQPSYYIFYVPSDERINVLAIVHQHRDPASYLGRLR